MLRNLLPLAALAVVIPAGLLYGVWSGRWSDPAERRSRAEGLDKIPMVVGDWDGEPMSFDRRELEGASVDAYVMRRYTDRRTGRSVTVLIICGLPGPVSVHTPDVCYASVGYEARTLQEKLVIGPAGATPRDELWVVDLHKESATGPESLRVLYGWNGTGAWKASTSPRMDFGGEPALYKVYFVHATRGVGDPVGVGPGAELAEQLIPALRLALPLAAPPGRPKA